MLCLLPSLVALVGAAMALFMAGQRREGELALVGLAGVTPGGQLRQVSAEAISVTVTGLILAVGGLVLVGFATAVMLAEVFPVVVISPSSATVATCAILSTTITLLAGIVPVVPMLRRPAHRVLLSVH